MCARLRTLAVNGAGNDTASGATNKILTPVIGHEMKEITEL